jgi:hypothetical protein
VVLLLLVAVLVLLLLRRRLLLLRRLLLGLTALRRDWPARQAVLTPRAATVAALLRQRRSAPAAARLGKAAQRLVAVLRADARRVAAREQRTAVLLLLALRLSLRQSLRLRQRALR